MATVATVIAILLFVAVAVLLAVATVRRFAPSFRERHRGRGGHEDDGLAGVREPRRPSPVSGGAAALADPDDSVFE